MNLTYLELFNILFAAKSKFNQLYKDFGEESDLEMKNLASELIDFINNSPAEFFTIKEDDPF